MAAAEAVAAKAAMMAVMNCMICVVVGMVVRDGKMFGRCLLDLWLEKSW